MSEDQDTLFLDIALEKGLVTDEQGEEARRAKAHVTEVGLKRSLPSIMLEKGLVSQDQARQIRAEMARRGVYVRLGGYEVISRVGEGGMGTVYRAKQTSLGRTVALKVLPSSLAKDKTYLERFYREARIAGGLSHPNVVAVYDVGEDAGRHYIAMEYITGKTVSQVLEEEGPFDEARAIDIITDVTRGLAHAHERQIIHRDIKPSNILLTKEGVAKLSDLGIAKHTGAEDVSLTRSGTAVGTPCYMAPEQAQQAKDADARCDIYSLGASLYHMVAGEVPFTGDTPYEVILKHVTEPLPSPKTHNPAVSDGICGLISKMMAKDPKDRMQSAHELLEEIARLCGIPVTDVAHATTRHRPLSVTKTVVGPKRRRRWPFYARVAVVAVAVLVFLGLIIARGRENAAYKAARNGVRLFNDGQYADALAAFAEVDLDRLDPEDRKAVGKAIAEAERFVKEPAAEPQPAVAVLPKPSPRPPEPKPGPEARPTPAPEPTVEPSPTPTPAWKPRPKPTPQPVPILKPAPEPAPQPEPAAAQDRFRNVIGMTMVRVPPGSLAGRDGRQFHVPELHFSAHEVTNGQFLVFGREIMDLTRKMREPAENDKLRLVMYRLKQVMPQLKKAEPDFPVLGVTGVEAMIFCRWLSRRDKRAYRLPTPIEWQYACRAGTTTRYYWGDRADKQKANFAGAFGRKSKPMKVGSFPPNPWGFYDMLGNAAEWCAARRRYRPEPDFYLLGGAYDVSMRMAAAQGKVRIADSHKRPSAGLRVLHDPAAPHYRPRLY